MATSPNQWFDHLRRDVVYAWRSLRTTPGFAITGLLSLAVGLTATTAFYALADHIAIRPLPYPHPEQLSVLREILPDLVPKYSSLPASGVAYLEWRSRCRTCSDVAAFTARGFTLSGGAEPERERGLRASANLLNLLGAKLTLGRGFGSEEDRAGQSQVVILSEGIWRRRFGADPSIVGRTITLDGAPFVVLGVVSSEFQPPKRKEFGDLLDLESEVDLYVPLALTTDEATAPYQNNFGVIARRRSEATIDQMTAEIAAIEASLGERLKIRVTATVTALASVMVGPVRDALLLLFAASAALLVMVSLNLGSLFASRWAQRSRESAVRAAIGASRGQLMRLSIVESLLLPAGGGLLAAVWAPWAVAALVRMAPSSIPRLDEVRVDWRTLLIGLLLPTIVGMLMGAIPAIRASQVNPGDLLVSTFRVSGSRASRWSGRLLIASQASLSIFLVLITGLLLESFIRVLGVDKGFNPNRIVTVEAVTPPSFSTEQRVAFFSRAIERLNAIPGVQAAGVTNSLPLTGEAEIAVIDKQRSVGANPTDRPSINVRYVSPSYFAVIGATILRGRGFSERDRLKPVTVVSRAAARALWPGEDAVGKHPTGMGPSPIVLGVVADVRTKGLEQDVSPIIYVPYWYLPDRPVTVVVKVVQPTPGMAQTIRGELSQIDPSVAISRAGSLDAVVSRALEQRRFQLVLLGLFALTVLVTASIGVYGVVSQWLTNRRIEIGIRMALGASPNGIRALVLREELAPALAGIVIGLVGSLAAGQALRTMLFAVAPTDPLVISIAMATVAFTSALACYVPLRRALDRDPMVSLRTE